MTPRNVQSWLQNEGYKARLDEDDQTTAVIESGFDGTPFRICFWRSDPFDGDLDAFWDVSFFSAAEADGRDTVDKVNVANAENRYVKATLENGTVYYSMDIAASSATLTDALFIQYFEAWTDWLPEMIEGTVR